MHLLTSLCVSTLSPVLDSYFHKVHNCFPDGIYILSGER